MFEIFVTVAAFIAGYVAAVFTWDGVHAWLIGAEEKAQLLRDTAARY